MTRSLDVMPIVREDDEMFMTRSLDVTPNTPEKRI